MESLLERLSFISFDMLSALGQIQVDIPSSRVVVNVSQDFVRYYNWFIKKKYWISLHSPMHRAHITLANSKLHRGVDYRLASTLYHGKAVRFDYDPDLVRGGQTKGFVMFYARVFSPDLSRIKKELGVVEHEQYKGLHITIGNGKQGVMPYWPEMIKI